MTPHANVHWGCELLHLLPAHAIWWTAAQTLFIADPPPEAGIKVEEEPWLLGAFACCHHPQPHPPRHEQAGHLPRPGHPARLRRLHRQAPAESCYAQSTVMNSCRG